MNSDSQLFVCYCVCEFVARVLSISNWKSDEKNQRKKKSTERSKRKNNKWSTFSQRCVRHSPHVQCTHEIITRNMLFQRVFCQLTWSSSSTSSHHTHISSTFSGITYETVVIPELYRQCDKQWPNEDEKNEKGAEGDWEKMFENDEFNISIAIHHRRHHRQFVWDDANPFNWCFPPPLSLFVCLSVFVACRPGEITLKNKHWIKYLN